MKEKKRILLVEDEKELLESIKIALENFGYDCDIALDAEKGLELIDKHVYDLILLDIILPRMDGYEFLERLKNKGAPFKDIPIIFLSAKIQKSDLQKGLTLGAKVYIKKPYDHQTLLKGIEDALKINHVQRKYDVVIVDDEPELVESLQIALSSHGFFCHIAFDGEAGLKLVRNIKPNLILLDVLLPKMDGYLFCKNIKKDSQLKDIPIILYSNRDPLIKIQWKEVGADAWLPTPFSTNDLLNLVDQLIKKHIKKAA